MRGCALERNGAFRTARAVVVACTRRHPSPGPRAWTSVRGHASPAPRAAPRTHEVVAPADDALAVGLGRDVRVQLPASRNGGSLPSRHHSQEHKRAHCPPHLQQCCGSAIEPDADFVQEKRSEHKKDGESKPRPRRAAARRHTPPPLHSTSLHHNAPLQRALAHARRAPTRFRWPPRSHACHIMRLKYASSGTDADSWW